MATEQHFLFYQNIILFYNVENNINLTQQKNTKRATIYRKNELKYIVAFRNSDRKKEKDEKKFPCFSIKYPRKDKK